MNIKNLFKQTKNIDTDNINGNALPIKEGIDNDILNILKKLSNNIDTIFDVGACHGRYSLAAKKIFPNAEYHLFEPFPNAFSELEKNIKISNLKASINNIALSNFKGNTDFHINKLHETNSLSKAIKTNSQIDDLTTNENIISVGIDTLDNYIEEKKISEINILKIDVQGNTFEVLEGAIRLLSKQKIDVIQCEVEFIPIYENQKLFHHVASFLEEFGYILYSMYNMHYDINSRLSWADAVFINEKINFNENI